MSTAIRDRAGGERRALTQRGDVLDWSRPSGPTIVAAIMAVAQVCWHVWALAAGYFTQDDFLFIARADSEPLSAGHLLYEHNGHLMPGQFLLIWVITRLAPLSWPAAIAPIIMMEALSFVMLWLLLVRLFGRRWGILVPFAAVVCSPLVFVATMWWAVALQLIPFQLVLFGALHAQAGYLRNGQRRDAMAALCWVVAGLLMWEKALLIVPVVLGVTVLAWPGGAKAAMRRHWRVASAYGVVVAGYLAVYAAVMWRTDRPALDALQTLKLARRLTTEALLPGLFGGPWTVNLFSVQTLVVPPDGVLAAGWVLAGLVVVAGVLVGRWRAVGAWLLLAAYLAAACLELATGRLQLIGPVIGWDYRLIADAVGVAAVCGALAFMAPRFGDAEPAVVDRRRTLAGVAVLVTVAVFVVGATITSARSVPQAQNQAARDYVERVDAVLALEPDLMLYDAPVPDHVMMWLFGDQQRMASLVLGPLGARFDAPTGDLRMLDGDGAPRQIGLVDVVTARPGPASGCGYPVGRSGTRIRLTDFTEGPRRVVQIGYYTQRPSLGSVSTPTGQYAVHFEAALGYVYIVTDGPFDELLVSAEDNVCVTGVLVGTPLPRPS